MAVGARVSVEAVATVEAADELGGLSPHVGEEVNSGLLHASVGWPGRSVMNGVQPEAELHCASPEDQRPASRLVKCDVVRHGARGNSRAGIDQQALHPLGLPGKVNEALRPEPVVGVSIKLVPYGVRRQCGSLPSRHVGDRGMSPEAQLCVLRRDFQREVGRRIRHVDRAGQPVLWAPTVAGRAMPSITPSSRPRRRVTWIEGGSEMCLLVGHNSSVGRVAGVDASFPSGLPEQRVASEEC